MTQVPSGVIDANVVLSGLVGKQGGQTPPGRVLDAWRRGLFTMVISIHLKDEIARALRKPYFQRSVTEDETQRFFDELARHTVLVDPYPHLRQRTGTEDDVVLATALAGGADYLVTGDAELLALRQHENVRIVTASEFLRALDP